MRRRQLAPERSSMCGLLVGRSKPSQVNRVGRVPATARRDASPYRGRSNPLTKLKPFLVAAVFANTLQPMRRLLPRLVFVIRGRCRYFL
jgi:hypothetical protein